MRGFSLCVLLGGFVEIGIKDAGRCLGSFVLYSVQSGSENDGRVGDDAVYEI